MSIEYLSDALEGRSSYMYSRPLEALLFTEDLSKDFN